MIDLTKRDPVVEPYSKQYWVRELTTLALKVENARLDMLGAGSKALGRSSDPNQRLSELTTAVIDMSKRLDKLVQPYI